MDTFDAGDLSDFSDWDEWDPLFNSDESFAKADDFFYKPETDFSSQTFPRHIPKPGRKVLPAVSSSLVGSRIVWTPTLQKSFVDALIHLGVQYATPGSIVKQMNVQGLENENVATHLERYRLYWKRTRPQLLFDDSMLKEQQLLGLGDVGCLINPKPHGLVWDVLLHRTFVESLAQLGMRYCSSSQRIMHLMNVKDLTAEDVISHMKRYKPYLMGLKTTDARCQEKKTLHRSLITLPDQGELRKEENITVCSQLELQIMFHKILTPRDVNLPYLFTIPEEQAKKYFPSLIMENTILLDFEDPIGKLWQFQYSWYDHVLIGGWMDFVKEKELVAGDVVSFHRKVGDKSGGGNQFFIHWSHIANAFKPALPFDDIIAQDALLYCALFPFDHEFEKDTLLQLWMAVGIFVDEPMERIAALFLEDCLAKGYFQICRTNLTTGKTTYKFKGDSRLFPLLISSGNHIVQVDGITKLKDISSEVSHMSMRCRSLKHTAALHKFKRFKQLKTLMFLQGRESSFTQVPRDFFLSLGVLQALDLRQTRLTELPTSIGNMKRLRYLSLAETPIKRLPETIECLETLQTLKLKGCSNLFALPRGMSKLINLRHLEFDVLHQLRSMPQGMGALTNIRTLSAFLVGKEQGCSIRQLKNMNNLSGSLCISRLENVLAEAEAMEAYLCCKSDITKLELHWTDAKDDVPGLEKIVLSSLQPYTNLEELRITCYGGFELPRWICDPAFFKLVKITLFECVNCLVLPSLGQLPSLKFLNIVDFHMLKVIDHDFYGGLGVPGYIAFPNLEKLAFENMFNLEEWTGIKSSDFPCLLKLTIKHCPKLHSLCTLSCLSSLENLEISHCDVLASCPDDNLPAVLETFIIEDCPLISARFLNDGSQDCPKVSHIQHTWIDHQEMSFGRRSSKFQKQRQDIL